MKFKLPEVESRAEWCEKEAAFWEKGGERGEAKLTVSLRLICRGCDRRVEIISQQASQLASIKAQQTSLSASSSPREGAGIMDARRPQLNKHLCWQVQRPNESWVSVTRVTHSSTVIIIGTFTPHEKLKVSWTRGTYSSTGMIAGGFVAPRSRRNLYRSKLVSSIPTSNFQPPTLTSES